MSHVTVSVRGICEICKERQVLNVPPMIFLDWSQYRAPRWAKACPGVDLSDLIGGWSGSKVVELLELQTLYLIGREERTLYYQCVGLANQGVAQWLRFLNS